MSYIHLFYNIFSNDKFQRKTFDQNERSCENFGSKMKKEKKLGRVWLTWLVDMYSFNWFVPYLMFDCNWWKKLKCPTSLSKIFILPAVQLFFWTEVDMMNLPVKMIFNLIFFIIFLTVASTPTVILTIEEHNCSKGIKDVGVL